MKPRNDDHKMFCIYKKFDGLLEDVMNMKPLSIVIVMNNDEICLYCVAGKKRYIDSTLKYIGHRIVTEESEYVSKEFGLCYYDIQVAENNKKEFIKDDFSAYAIGLPFNNKYTFITSNWTEVIQLKTNNSYVLSEMNSRIQE